MTFFLPKSEYSTVFLMPCHATFPKLCAIVHFVTLITQASFPYNIKGSTIELKLKLKLNLWLTAPKGATPVN